MNSQSLQKLVKKIFSDEQTRLQFEADPGKVLAQYKLSNEEKRAILSTHTKLGLVTSGSPQLEATLKADEGWAAPQP